MKRACDSCGEEYEAKRPSSRYCSETHRKRAQRGHVMASPMSAPPTVQPDRSTVDAVRAELTDAGRIDTFLGRAALALAARIDSATAVMGFAALVKELRATMAAATEGVAVAADPVDELRARRDRIYRAG